MLDYILSFLWKKKENSLSLDEAYAISEENFKVQTQEKNKHIEEEIQNFETFVKIGKITNIEDNECTIDDIYKYKSDHMNLNYIGQNVSYQLLKEKGEIEVINVKIVDNDWDMIVPEKKNWCTRIIICQVIERIDRTIILSPNNIKLDLNKICLEFIPIVGDWVELDVKAAIDESFTDLMGDILEINIVRPARSQVKIGKVTSWNSFNQTGIIDKTIWFNLYALNEGYIPVVGDVVVARIIESEQGLFSWRALNIILEYLQVKELSLKNDLFNQFKDEVEGVKISKDLIVTLKHLGASTTFNIDITNESSKEIILERIEIPNTTQIKILNKIVNISIEPYKTISIYFECVGRNIGESQQALLFFFKNFQLKRWINIFVDDDDDKYHKKNHKQYNNKMSSNENFYENRDVICGERKNMPSRFIKINLPDYSIPKKMFELILNLNKKEKSNDEIMQALESFKPVLKKELNFINYENKYHTLIHLEDIATTIAMKVYDKDRACFIRCGEYLLLEIKNLSEMRPSIIIGDKIVAQNIFNSRSPDFEGIVHKVGANHLYLKFSSLFHNIYNGEDYRIKAVCSRTMYKRQHYAIGMAVKVLGENILFPLKVIEKEPQVKFFESNRKIGKLLKLEWINKKLNQFQKQAVKRILYGVCRPLPYLIFGPPGTGKTITLVEAILQVVRLISHVRILVTTPSNSAADLICSRLIESELLKPGDIVRLVSLTACDKISAKLAPYTATANTEIEGTETLDSFVTKSGLTLGSNSLSLGRHKITVTTCSTAGLLHVMGFSRGHFSHIFIDEAGQTSEPMIMIPLTFLDVNSGQAILAGDPLQLGPVILSSIAAQYGLEESYLERLMNRFPYVRDPAGFPKNNGYDPRLVTKLIYNYRSLPSLLELPSSMFYHNDLIPTISEIDSVEATIIKKLKEILPTSKGNKGLPSIVFHGVIGQNYQSEESPSWFNPNEASQVFFYVNELYRLGLSVNDIGIITPYKAQTRQLNELFNEAEFEIPKIGTVEEFQGQEFNVILLSTVRSSISIGDLQRDNIYKMGFISSPRRLNVSITRAKALLLIIGDPKLLYNDKCWRSIIDYCLTKNSYIGCKI